MVFQDFLTPVFSPLFKIHPLLAIIIISFLISLFITLIYKKFTNQKLMKDLKEEIKELQKEMKELKDKPKEMMKVQKKAMETNMKYMMHSFKPTLLTFIPIIIIFGWLNAHFAYLPITEDTQFSISVDFIDNTNGNITITVPENIELLNEPTQKILNNKAEWFLKAKSGTYFIKYSFNSLSFQHKLIVTKTVENRSYVKPVMSYKELGLDKYSRVKQLVISNKKIKPFEGIPVLGSIPWIGGFGWFGSYVLFSIIFSMLLRKAMKVY